MQDIILKQLRPDSYEIIAFNKAWLNSLRSPKTRELPIDRETDCFLTKSLNEELIAHLADWPTEELRKWGNEALRMTDWRTENRLHYEYGKTPKVLAHAFFPCPK